MSYEDTIQSLPVEETLADPGQVGFAKSIFEDPKKQSAIYSEFSDSIILVFLFVIFNSEKADNLIRQYVPITRNSNVYLVALKCVLFVFLFYIIKNFQLIRK